VEYPSSACSARTCTNLYGTMTVDFKNATMTLGHPTPTGGQSFPIAALNADRVSSAVYTADRDSPDAVMSRSFCNHPGSGQRQRYNPRRSAVTLTHAGTGCAPSTRSSRSNAVTSSCGGGSGGGQYQSAGPRDRSGLTSAICRIRR